jgi:Secretion system C-terminal sorting domain
LNIKFSKGKNWITIKYILRPDNTDFVYSQNICIFTAVITIHSFTHNPLKMIKHLFYFQVLVFSVLLSLSAKAQNIFSGEPVQIAGALNGYTTTPYNSDYRTTVYRKLSFTTGTPADGRGQWASTINVQNTGGNVMPVNMLGGPGNGFLFITGPASNRFQNKWGFASVGQGAVNSVNINTAFNSGNDMGLDMSTTGFYTFVFNDCGYTQTNASYYVGYTTAAPITPTRTSDIGNPDGSTNIGINTSGTISPEEKVYVRYTLGADFASTGTSFIVQATGSGSTFNAILPTQANGTVLRYYIFTSTQSLATLGAAIEMDKSLAILKYDDNSGNNYTHTVVLPVNLTAFTGKLSGSNIILQWNTEAEINIDRYELLRSVDGLQFYSIYSVPAKNITSASTYQYIDKAVSKIVYYKIAIYEKDGTYSFSDILTIKTIVKNTTIVVYPNPVVDNISFFIPTTQKGNYEINIYNKIGQLVLVKAIKLEDVNTKIKIPLPSTFARGSYTLKINGLDTNVATSFIVP